MNASVPISGSDSMLDPVASADESRPWGNRAPSSLMAVIAAALAMAFFFVVDLIMPRGATPAIGYAIVPVLAAGTRKRSLVLWMTAICTVLTWIGYFLEPVGAPAWMSGFDRLMITAVLWLTTILVCRRQRLLYALAEHAEALEAARDELIRSNEELDRFAGVVAHDLRGPLHAIGLLVRIVLHDCREVLDAHSAESVSDIQQEVESMSRLIQRLLSYARVGSGALQRERCDCNAVLEHAVEPLRAALAEAGGTITHEALPELQADPILLRELLQNLVENAIKYRSTRPPRIYVSARAQGQSWVLCLEDNGIGIDLPDQQSIFRPFAQAARSRERGGVGLGLATCKRIVERHGGTISVQSTPGQGSRFEICLPTQ